VTNPDFDPIRSTKLPTFQGWLLPLLVVGVSWYAVIRILWADWRMDPQYSYGLLVPLLVLGLFLKRWEDCPKPSLLTPSLKWKVRLILFGATLLIAAIIPMSEANPDWRPLSGAASLAAVTVSLSLILLAGGLPLLRHFAFPICFFLVAVPWPRNLEQGVMFPLMEWNTAVTLEILHWVGVEASSQGNLIMLPSGILGIEEGCSGIRSLQSGLMAALFFGEVFRLRWGHRFLLLVVAVLAALFGNICRNSLLALVASSWGLKAVSGWHDPAGMLVLLITVAVIFWFAWCWRAHAHEVAHPEKLDASAIVARLSPFVLIPVLILLTGSLLGTEVWFAAHERGRVNPWSWNLHAREGERGVVAVPISPTTLRILYYPEGFSEKWVAGHHEQGQVFYFQWPPGRTAAQVMTMHNPEVCLENIGIVLKSRLQPSVMTLGKEQVSFNAWLFDDHGIPVYVFHSLVEQGGETGATNVLNDSPSGRLDALIKGYRNHGQRMMEVAFWNLPSEQAARQELVNYLHQSVKPASPADFTNPIRP
jgi:exosortase